MATVLEYKAASLIHDRDDAQHYIRSLRFAPEALGAELDSLAAAIKELESAAAARREQARKLTASAAAAEASAQALRDRVKELMDEQGVNAHMGVLHNIVLAPAGGNPPVVITGEVPLELCTITPNKSAIALLLKQGEKLDFAEFGERSISLRIS